jgi:phosphoribosyl-ATP pyrophosphohydrolase
VAFTLAELEEVLRARRQELPGNSYTARLLADEELIQRKIMEEAFETCLEIGRPAADRTRVISEAADLVYHLLVGLVAVDVSFDEVLGELKRRRS